MKSCHTRIGMAGWVCCILVLLCTTVVCQETFECDGAYEGLEKSLDISRWQDGVPDCCDGADETETSLLDVSISLDCEDILTRQQSYISRTSENARNMLKIKARMVNATKKGHKQAKKQLKVLRQSYHKLRKKLNSSPSRELYYAHQAAKEQYDITEWMASSTPSNPFGKHRIYMHLSLSPCLTYMIHQKILKGGSSEPHYHTYMFELCLFRYVSQWIIPPSLLDDPVSRKWIESTLPTYEVLMEKYGHLVPHTEAPAMSGRFQQWVDIPLSSTLIFPTLSDAHVTNLTSQLYSASFAPKAHLYHGGMLCGAHGYQHISRQMRVWFQCPIDQSYTVPSSMDLGDWYEWMLPYTKVVSMYENGACQFEALISTPAACEESQLATFIQGT